MASAGPQDLPVELWAACLRFLRPEAGPDPVSAQQTTLKLLRDLTRVSATSRRLKAATVTAALQSVTQLDLPDAATRLASALLLELCGGVTKLVLRLDSVPPLSQKDAGALLTKLKGSLPSLAHLELWLPPGPVRFPAKLARDMPASLQHVGLCIQLNTPHDTDPWGPSPKVALDFRAFDPAQLSISLAADTLGDMVHGEIIQSSLLPALSAVGRIHSLCLPLDEGAVAEVHWLSKLQVQELTLKVVHNPEVAEDHWRGEPASFYAFPACRRLEVSYLTAAAPVMTINWEALAAKPGVYVLGSEAQSLTTSLEILDFGCPTTFPEFTQPWALVVYGQLRWVGLEELTFVEERPGMHVCRNKAAASLQLQ